MKRELSVHDIDLSYGDVRAVRNLSFEVPRGQIVGLLGANGAGKTTTMRIIAGLLAPDEGRVRIDGTDTTGDAHRAAAQLGVVFGENSAPEPAMGVRQYLLHFAKLANVDTADDRICELTRDLDLQKFATRPIGTLSGGNRRKVEIARALLNEPQYLLLDEPTRELDIPTKEDLWCLLMERANAGTGILLCTHEAPEVAAICDELVILHNGTVRWRGPVTDLPPGRIDQALAAMIRPLN